jgi:hypothetical protein
MKSGKLLESIVAIVQEATKSDSSISIKLNEKIIDLVGNEREIDVLISGSVNLIKVNVAIECKDYSSRVSVDKVDSFKAKCEFLPNIDKLVFVSKSGFQKASIKKAFAYGIDLYTLKEMTDLTITNWFSEFRVQAIQVTRRISHLEIDFDTNPLDDYLPSDTVVIENDKVKKTLLQLIQDIIDVSFPRKRFRASFEGNDLPEIEKYCVTLKLLDTYILRGEVRSDIYSIKVEVSDHYTHQESETRSSYYQDQFENIKIPTITVASEDGNIFTAVGKENSQIDLYMRLSPNEALVEGVNIIKLGTIDKG